MLGRPPTIRMHGDKEIIRECEIDGKRQPFNAFSTDSLENAKKFYANFKYIGSGRIIYYNGTKNIFKEDHHFFI